MYTTDLLDLYFMFFMICHGLLVAMFLMFYSLFIVCYKLYTKNIKPLANDNKRDTKIE